MSYVYNRRPIISRRRNWQKFNRFSRQVWKLNAVLAAVGIAFVIIRYGYYFDGNMGVFIPNFGGYNLDLGGF
tara:strand:+ start:496 stop:711 length:216 start_codon:yes stop_codon:yes gene_type:complete